MGTLKIWDSNSGIWRYAGAGRTDKPSASIVPDAQQANFVTATGTVVAFGATEWDTDGMADLANDRLIINTAGIYLCTANISWTAPGAAASGYRQTQLNVNGTASANQRFVSRRVTEGANAGVYGVIASGLCKLNVGDFIQAIGIHTQGTTVTAPLYQAANPAFTNLQAVLVSPT